MDEGCPITASCMLFNLQSPCAFRQRHGALSVRGPSHAKPERALPRPAKRPALERGFRWLCPGPAFSKARIAQRFTM